MSISQTILDIAEICVQRGVNNLVMSPGSRNAPLTLAFNRHPQITSRIIGDERAAGYIALGMAQSLKQPVMLLSTSGTAALNFGPAIAEAFYQQVPLLVFTADRPPEWIDQHDGQAIRQRDVFKHHAKKSFELPVSLGHNDAKWHAHRMVNEAISTTQNGAQGPVHINAPFREPFYPEVEHSWQYSKEVPVVNFRNSKKNLSKQQWDLLVDQWSNADKVMIVGGQGAFSQDLTNVLGHLQSHASVPLLADAVSNLHQVKQVVNHGEIILGQSAERLEKLCPDLLITFGGSLISKNLKLFLRNNPAAIHWHIQPSAYPPDTFKSLSEVIEMDPTAFFTDLVCLVPQKDPSEWCLQWQQQEHQARSWIKEFLDSREFNELQAVDKVLQSTKETHLHLANSSPVRWVDLLGVKPDTIEVSANRGTSGIDGCSSTSVGHAMISNEQHLLITGDMAFFYDRNAFWHQYKTPNLKIILLNNHGGGIFRLIDGPSQQPELEDLFVTRQQLMAENSAADFGMKYLYCNNIQDLDVRMAELMEPHDQAAILEIEVPNNMSGIYKELKASIKQL